MKKLWSHVTKCQKLFVVTLVLAGILWMTGFNPVDSGAGPREVEAATIKYSGKDGDINWSIDSEGCLKIEGEGDYSNHEWNKYEYTKYIKKAVIKIKNVTSLENLFSGCGSLSTVDLSGLDTKNVTSMKKMFRGCSNLTSIDLSNFNTSNVMDMSEMFCRCTGLKKLDLTNFDTSKVTDMSEMFSRCNLAQIDLSNFDTSNVTNMANMFSYCEKISTLDLKTFDTKNVVDMSGMFYYCTELKKIDLSNFSTENVMDTNRMFGYCKNLSILNFNNFDMKNTKDMSEMFYSCEKLENLDFSKISARDVTNMSKMFYYCYKISTLDLSNFGTSKVVDMSELFSSCYNLTNLDLSSFDTGNVKNMERMFEGCSGLTKLDLSNFNTSNVTNMSDMFSYCLGLVDLNLSSFNTSNVTNMEYMFRDCDSLEKLDLSSFDTSNVENMLSMFSNCLELKSLDLSNFDTRKITNMDGLFFYCLKLEKLDVSNFNTNNVTNMKDMFGYCGKLLKLDLNSFDTRNVTDMSGMFRGCKSLVELTLDNFNTDNVTNMNEIFYECKSLVKLGLDNFNTNKITDMSKMFYGCQSLLELNLDKFDTKNVTDMDKMFYECKNLSKLNLNNFDTLEVTDMSDMFFDCENLTEVILDNFNTENVTDMGGMFYQCNNLEKLDLSNFNTSELRNMTSMFYGCSNLKNLNVNNFNTIHITDMEEVFYGCNSLTKLDLSNIDTRNVTDMEKMFCGCSSLVEIDVSNFKTTKVTDMEKMFYGCSSLVKLDLTSFDISNVKWTGDIFDGCINLREINTPVNRKETQGKLPYVRGMQWTDVYGNVYEYLPGNIDHNITLNFGVPRIKLKEDSVDLEKTEYEYTGDEIKPVVTVKDETGNALIQDKDYTIFYENNINAGVAKVVITGMENYIGLITSEFTINPKEFKSVGVSVLLEQTEYEYTGNEIQPTVTVKDISGKILTKDIDYTVSCENNINLGKAEVIVTGKGNYTGTLNTKFTIIQKSLNSEGMRVALEKTAYEYTGTPIQPTVIVKDASEKVLTEDTDYTVSYENNTNAGTATVTVAGKGNYTGAVPVEFTINPKVLTLKDEDVTVANNGFVCDGNVYEYTGEEIKPVLTINGLAEGTDYELSYKNNVEEGIATVTAACKGNYSGEYIYEYTIVKEPIFTWNKEKCTSDTGIPKVTVRERIDPTCGKAGKILYVATLEHMGKVYTSENEVQLLATGKHSWDEGVVKGSQLIYTCKVCKQTKSVEKKVKSIAITGLSHNIAAGKKVALTAEVCPVDAINKKVVWTTSNKKVATVNQSGIVSVRKKTGKKSVIITATATDGSRVKQSFKITSMKGVVKKVSLSGKKTLAVGKSMKVKAKVKASGGSYKKLKWTSSNAKYATVSSKGTVKAQKAGKGKKVMITAMALDGSGKKATLKIKVK